jgi:hypothetical protein
MWVEDVDVIYEEHSVEGLDEELYLFPAVSPVPTFTVEENIPRSKQPSTVRSPNSPAHRSSADS